MKTPATDELHAIKELLSVSGLPTDDLREQDLSLFRVDVSSGALDAVGGLERFGDTALLRSIATSAPMQGRGIASKIVDELEELAVNEGVNCLYLLTESAEHYFESKGYSLVNRFDVPPSIQESRQLSSLCPDSATVMCKWVGG